MTRRHSGQCMCLVWLGCLLFTITSSPAYARKGVTQGFVDLKVVLKKVCDGVSAKKRLRFYKERFQSSINQQQQELKQQRQQYQSKKNLPADMRLQLRNKLQMGLVKLQRTYKQLSQRLRELEAQETKRIFAKMRHLIRTLAKQQQLIFVFEKSQSSLLYAREDRDFTKELIRIYQRTHCRGAKGTESRSSNRHKKSKNLRLQLKELGIDTQ